MGFSERIYAEVFGDNRPLSLARRMWRLLTNRRADLRKGFQTAATHSREDNPVASEARPERKVQLSANSALYIRTKGTRFDGRAKDVHQAVRMTLELARVESNGFVDVFDDSSEIYKMSMWAHAQLMRIVITGYEPSAEQMDKALELVEQLRVDYARAGIVLTPFRLPSRIENNIQRSYAQMHRQHFRHLKPFACK